MVRPSLKEYAREIPLDIKEFFVWFSARRDTPKKWFSGGYSRIKIVRLSLAIIALLAYSAYALGTDFTAATYINLWYGLAESAYIVIAVVFLLGLRTWYAPSVLFPVVSGVINYLIRASGGPLGLGMGASLGFAAVVDLGWLYLIFVGMVMMRYDKGSKLNDMLTPS